MTDDVKGFVILVPLTYYFENPQTFVKQSFLQIMYNAVTLFTIWGDLEEKGY